MHCLLVTNLCFILPICPACNVTMDWCICSVNDVEEKYYADGENAYDMRKVFKKLAGKGAAPKLQLKSAESKQPKAAAGVHQATDASQENDVADQETQATSEHDKSADLQQDQSKAGANNKENSSRGAAQEEKSSQSKGKGARSKKR